MELFHFCQNKLKLQIWLSKPQQCSSPYTYTETMLKMTCITIVMAWCSLWTGIVLAEESNHLYKKVTAGSAWWDVAKLPIGTLIASSLVMCASRCSNHVQCDFFQYQADSTCQLGKGDMPAQTSVADQGVAIHKRTDSCIELEGCQTHYVLLIFLFTFGILYTTDKTM